jgi:hypothetical protein
MILMEPVLTLAEELWVALLVELEHQLNLL